MINYPIHTAYTGLVCSTNSTNSLSSARSSVWVHSRKKKKLNPAQTSEGSFSCEYFHYQVFCQCPMRKKNHGGYSKRKRLVWLSEYKTSTQLSQRQWIDTAATTAQPGRQGDSWHSLTEKLRVGVLRTWVHIPGQNRARDHKAGTQTSEEAVGGWF